MSLPPQPYVLSDKEITFLIVVESAQLVCGVALLLQFTYTWLKMRRLNVLIRFMKKLLIMVFIKSVS